MGWYHHYTIGIILFWQSHFVNDDSIRKSVTSTVAAILGMIPEVISSYYDRTGTQYDESGKTKSPAARYEKYRDTGTC